MSWIATQKWKINGRVTISQEFQTKAEARRWAIRNIPKLDEYCQLTREGFTVREKEDESDAPA